MKYNAAICPLVWLQEDEVDGGSKRGAEGGGGGGSPKKHKAGQSAAAAAAAAAAAVVEEEEDEWREESLTKDEQDLYLGYDVRPLFVRDHFFLHMPLARLATCLPTSSPCCELTNTAVLCHCRMIRLMTMTMMVILCTAMLRRLCGEAPAHGSTLRPASTLPQQRRRHVSRCATLNCARLFPGCTVTCAVAACCAVPIG